METETELFVEHTLFDGPGTWDALMGGADTYLNAELATYYGLTNAPTGSGFQRVTLDPRRAAGLLTQGSLLTINAHSNQTSPVHRGKLVRETFLCQILPAPPANVNIAVPEPNPNSTARERFKAHSADVACVGCHVLMDPIGFGFENYDGVGVWRELESGQRIDASGSVSNVDLGMPFDGPSQLATQLISSKVAQRCYVQQWFRFSAGRGETLLDACTLEQLDKSFETNGRDVKSLLRALTQTDAFRYRSGGTTP